MNIGSTYDGDMGNEVILGDIIVTGFNNAEDLKPSSVYQWDNGGTKTDRFKPWKLCNGSMIFTMRELMMVESLDYYSTRRGSKTMNNISNIYLEYNFNNSRNMIHFNCGKIYAMSKKYYVDKGK